MPSTVLRPESHLAFTTVEHSGDEDEEIEVWQSSVKARKQNPTQSHREPRSGLLSTASLPFSPKNRQSYPTLFIHAVHSTPNTPLSPLPANFQLALQDTYQIFHVKGFVEDAKGHSTRKELNWD